jgi:serine/threonine protein kinase/Tfp pilus assembly protein PilF
MSAEEKRICKTCGTALAPHDEFCPVCVFRGALGSDAAATESSEPPTTRFGHYEILRHEDGSLLELGRGAMGITYKGFDIDLRRFAALKVISPRYLAEEAVRSRFLREARAAASVRHANVASVFHLGTNDENYFYAMEFVEGETLNDLIKRCGPLEPRLALEIIGQVAAGLDAIHKENLVHRDIKPSNIMVNLAGEKVANVKIIDLGLAKGVLLQDDSISVTATQGAFVGTPAYASPEQFSGTQLDIRSDLYSLGVTLWQMVTGEIPFQGSFSELNYKHQHTPPPIDKLTQTPQPAKVLLKVLLEKDPSLRLQTPTELLQAILKVIQSLGSGRPITPDQLRSSADGIACGPKLSRRHFRPAWTGAGLRVFGWPLAVALSVVGLLIAWFLFPAYRGLFFNQRIAETAPTEKSVAVLPFESLSENKSDVYFADGVQDEILNNLAKIVQLKVISRTSVMQYRGDNKSDLRQIANALGVANVLEGTVRRDGNRVRVSTELVDARDDHTIWADSYDRDMIDIFSIQSEIAQKVASRLRAKLSPEERRDIEEKPTNNLEAYDLYLQAKHLPGVSSFVLWGSEKETYLRTISLLEEAIQQDPKFALAYCLIARANDFLYFDRIDHTPARRALADAAVNEALQLRPDLSEVHLAAALHLYTCYRDFEKARVQIAIAAQGLSNNPDVLELTSLIDRVQGRWESATAGLERAATLDPRNSELLGNLADNYGLLRRYRDAERILDQLIELEPDQPAFPLQKARTAFAEKADLQRVRAAYEAVPSSMKNDPEVTLFRCYYAMCARDFAAAREIVRESPNEEVLFVGAMVPREIYVLWHELLQGNHPSEEQFGAARDQLYRRVEADPTNPYLMTALALTDVALGNKEDGVQEGRRAIEMRAISDDAVEGPVIAANVALVYAWADQPDVAFEQLNILVQIPNDLVSYGNLKDYPGWDPLRQDPRFGKLLAKLARQD